MAQGRLIAIVCTFLAIGAGSYAWLASNRAKQREWPSVQMERAIDVATLISEYHIQNGEFPPSLDLLVTSGVISAPAFADLQFQASPTGERSPWVYRPPESMTSFAIASPNVVVPWKGSLGLYIAARADGGAQMIGHSKRASIEPLVTYQAEQGGAGQPATRSESK